ncbi:hypothetical protein Salat_2689300 [Sesamum alatum]|uniref:GAG-pre-integrase domain-containing protein n=1 Tax=Sesamum alatum TaxID=300844 RepID=A0AAE2CB87_9LAMI|nr:hypothetical protein Salat_2689300 [Sesamum alatum]
MAMFVAEVEIISANMGSVKSNASDCYDSVFVDLKSARRGTILTLVHFKSNECDQLNREQCFTTEVVQDSDNAPIGSSSNLTQINYADYNDEWIIDSRCSHHVSGDDTLFSELRQHNEKRVIVTTDNSTYPVAKEGFVKIDTDETSIKLDDVYHVPALKKNLISVSQITNSGKYVMFGPNDVKVLNNVKTVVADVVLSGENLFVMSLGEAYVKKTSQTDSAATWHARLGHVDYQMLQQISSKGLLDGLPTLKNVHEDVVCQGCQYGKSHHLSFKISSNRRTTSLELIHTDLMGPTKTPSCGNNHYVMVLVFDHSRKGWRCMDPTTKKSVTSRDVVFDEISSWKTGKEIAALPDSSENLKLSFQIDKQVSHNVESEYQESDESPTPSTNASRRESGDSMLEDL